MSAGAEGSFSLASTSPDGDTVYTPSVNDQSTDDFEIFINEDELYVDEDNRLHDLGSDCSTSVTPSIHRFETALGRQYHSYKSGRYPLPSDRSEHELEELKHHILQELLEGHLFFSDIKENPFKIFDIGTGAGTWAVDVADKYAQASVFGTDLSPVLSSWMPLNVEFFVDDCEEDVWLHGTGFDLVHMRDVCGFLQDHDALLSKVYRNLKVGGWAELQDFIPEIRCDDGSMEDDDPLRKFLDLAADGIRSLGCSKYGVYDAKESLEKAGFTNIHVVTKDIPIGPWVGDQKLRDIGSSMKVLAAWSLSALAAKPFAALGISQEQRVLLMEQASASLQDWRRSHRYVRFRVCCGQKPALEMPML